MTVIEGQTSIFDVLAAARTVKLPFTVLTGPGQYDEDFCAYCGTRRNLNESGCGPATVEHPDYRYSICDSCSEKYRTMRPFPAQWTFKEIQ